MGGDSHGLGEESAEMRVGTLHRSVVAATLLASAVDRPAVALSPPGHAVRTPWDAYKKFLAKEMPTLERCSTLAHRRGVFGDVRAHFDWRAKSHVTVQVTKSLGTQIRQCAAVELRPFAAKVYELLKEGTDFEASWELGTVRALFPAGDKFLQAWSDVVSPSASPATKQMATRTFARMLPADAKLVGGCVALQPPANFAFSEAVELWKKEGHFTAVDIFWDGKLGAVSNAPDAHIFVVAVPSPHLLVHIERHDDGSETDPRMARQLPRRPVPTTNELCLRPFDAALAAEVTQAMASAGQCWRNGPLESLVAPRFSFPASRAYARVGSTNRGQACALDTAGDIRCCGATTTTFTGRYRHLDVAGDVVCAVSTAGEASCVDIRTGNRTLTLAGMFERVSASTAGACGVNERAAIVCNWLVPRSERPPEGKFRDVDAGTLCAIDVSGALVCWGAGRIEHVAKGPWRQVTSGKTNNSSACALDSTGGPWCWSTAQPAASLARAPASVQLSQLAMGSGGPCGIDVSCGLHCWGGHAPFPPERLCVRDLSLGNPSCVVLQSGQTRCWGHDFWVDDHATKGSN
jgi:hypothetical protein